MSKHVPVLMKEVMEGLALKRGDVAVDATLGGGGYTEEMLKAVGEEGKVIALDRDASAIARYRQEHSVPENLFLVHGNFADIARVLKELKIDKVNAVAADLGFSLDQMEDSARGLSFRLEGPLDMRLDRSEKTTAADLLGSLSERELADIFRKYGNEPQARRVARSIVRAREERPLETTLQLAEIVVKAIGPRKNGKIHPATRIFQALRMAVNHERADLEAFLPQALDALVIGGRLAIVSFHSGEDMIVKRFLRTQARGCVCPSEFPVCRCKAVKRVEILTPKPLRPKPEEVAGNARARSAVLRIARRIA